MISQLELWGPHTPSGIAYYYVFNVFEVTFTVLQCRRRLLCAEVFE